MPSLYLHEHWFKIGKQQHTRRVFYGRVRLSPKDEGAVKPHEHTHRGPREDRIAMLRQLGAQVSPVFSMYRSPHPLASPDAPPDVDFELGDERHRFWVLSDAGDQAHVLAELANQSELYLSFYGDDLKYRYTKIVEHDEQQWQLLDDLVEQANEYLENISLDKRDFDRAKIEFMMRYG